MNKLLNRPLKAFIIYALLVLLVSIPVYVLVVDRIWVGELDENNWLTLQHTKNRLQSNTFTPEDLEKINQIWGQLQPGVSITKTEDFRSKQDSVYEAIRPNEYDLDDGEDRFRGLISYLKINGQPYKITIETNVEEADQTLLAVTVVTFLFFVILIIGFILLNRKISANSWRPFYKTLRSLQAFDLTKDQELNLPLTDIQEFEELNKSIQNLVKNNITAYKQQKSFTENASHELQTPIALLKSKLDLLIQEKGVTPEISQLLNSIEAPLARLSRINKNLLLLAKVENHQYSELEKLKVAEYMESALVLFEDYISTKQLKVTSHLKEGLNINSNAFLLETLLQNLLSNAIRHTSDKGEIHINIEGNSISLANSGVNALDQNQLFQRFASASKDKVSSGLGLAIIKEIASKYNLQVDYTFENRFHKFSVVF
ncbi:HAMP domain-containing sensor histidine kinase [uncultured Arcticibacterium sp.]|uniref:sensor histidine kinase n=1 Tax=uncultured Arcticibacterium sp. TaxID=2173042 RepID=UPI0030FC3C13